MGNLQWWVGWSEMGARTHKAQPQWPLTMEKSYCVCMEEEVNYKTQKLTQKKIALLNIHF